MVVYIVVWICVDWCDFFWCGCWNLGFCWWVLWWFFCDFFWFWWGCWVGGVCWYFLFVWWFLYRSVLFVFLLFWFCGGWYWVRDFWLVRLGGGVGSFWCFFGGLVVDGVWSVVCIILVICVGGYVFFLLFFWRFLLYLGNVCVGFW